MDPLPGDHAHLSELETRWTEVFQAHGPEADAAHRAQLALWQRYSGAIHRYLLKSVADPHVAEDLAQEFALRLIRGDFRNADPGRGRFRDFVKRSVANLMIDHHRRRARARTTQAEELVVPVEPDQSWIEADDRQFLAAWREELLNRAWRALEADQRRLGHPFFTVLRTRTDHPDLRSADLAELLTERLGRAVNANWVRQNVLRARERFVHALLDQVGGTLGDPAPEVLEDELIVLDLHAFCRDQLAGYHARRRPGR